MDKFVIIKINTSPDSLEQLGTKEKFWFTYKNNKYLFKYTKSVTGEHWSEKCAEEICKVLGIPHATYDIGLCGDRWGVISPNFIPHNFRMVMGNEVLHNHTPGYPKPVSDIEKQVRVREHTVTRVISCLENKILPPIFHNYDISGLTAGDVFCGYLMLDVLISNQDRHHENWAIMQDDQSGKRYLCPTYDHAASLGREMTDREKNERLNTKDINRSISKFVTKARSELFRTQKDTKRLLTIEAFEEAVKTRKEVMNFWISKLHDLNDECLKDIFARLDEKCISEVSRKFAFEMVKENRKRLLKQFFLGDEHE